MNVTRHWLPDPLPAAKRRKWPEGSHAGPCYFCGGPQPVWVRHGVHVCARHMARARAELKCQNCDDRPVSEKSLFANFCLECGEEWRKYTIRGNPWSVAA